MSVAFLKEDSAEVAQEVPLPDRSISPYPQGCSTLSTEPHGEDSLEAAESVGEAVLGDRVGLIAL